MPLRIAFLAANPVATHGWGRYARGLITALAALDPTAELQLIGSVDSPPPDKLNLPISSYHRVLPSLTPARRLLSLRLLAAVPRVGALTAGCDVVHIIAEPYALTLRPQPNIVVTAHGTYLPQTAQRKGFIGAQYRRIYNQAQVISVSNYTARMVRQVMPDLPHLTVIPNAVDFERFQHLPTRAEALRQVDKHGPTILVVGQIKPRKGIHLLAAAIKQIRAAIPDVEVVIIGDPTTSLDYVREIQAQTTADGIKDAVRWLGRVSESDLLSWFVAADVFALPAMTSGERFEGFGLVYLEANAAGLPVIGTHDSGAEDAIRDGETGFLIPQRDPSALAEAVITLLRDSELRARMGTAGRIHAATHTWARVAAQVRDVYLSIAAK